MQYLYIIKSATPKQLTAMILATITTRTIEWMDKQITNAAEVCFTENGKPKHTNMELFFEIQQKGKHRLYVQGKVAKQYGIKQASASCVLDFDATKVEAFGRYLKKQGYKVEVTAF